MEVVTYRPVEEYVPPQTVDIVLPDVTESVLKGQGRRLKAGHLADANPRGAKFPVNGVVDGPWFRPMVSLVVTNEQVQPPVSKHVVFVIDSTMPLTFLSSATFEAFFEVNPELKSTEANIHGTRTTVYRVPSESQFQGANVLGTQFFRDAHLTIMTDFSLLTVKLEARTRGT
ncbi:hypothetical protein JKP88DRAFT_327055 [Tribonema minus]|uniref:Uncharacterized protein n=1 Tax=Tribonema minus TaxID=303371 RepID=A0A835YQD7_9STRA|nr:hypothetical protein JKP88DRAFT_327055 [Tribonema minus]